MLASSAPSVPRPLSTESVVLLDHTKLQMEHHLTIMYPANNVFLDGATANGAFYRGLTGELILLDSFCIWMKPNYRQG
jgi:hypothetical protein